MPGFHFIPATFSVQDEQLSHNALGIADSEQNRTADLISPPSPVEVYDCCVIAYYQGLRTILRVQEQNLQYICYRGRQLHMDQMNLVCWVLYVGLLGIQLP